MQSPVACGSSWRVCPSNPRFHIFDPSGELRQARGDIFRGAHELTLVVEGDKEFRWFTGQCGAVGTYTLAEKRAGPIQQAGSMPHALICVAVLRGDYAIWVTDGIGGNVRRFWSPACMVLPLPEEYFYVNARTHKRIGTFDPNSTELRVIAWVAPSLAASRVLERSG
jgi:hypothetical protein